MNTATNRIIVKCQNRAQPAHLKCPFVTRFYFASVDSLRTQRRNINGVTNFASFKKGDENPTFEIIFHDGEIIRLHFLRVDFTTKLEGTIKGTVNLYKGDDVILSEVSFSIFKWCGYTTSKHLFCCSSFSQIGDLSAWRAKWYLEGP